MRILIIHNFYQHKGGEDVVVRQEMDELSRQHDVRLITVQNKKGWRGLLQYAFYPFNILDTLKISKEIEHFKPDVVHIHNMHYTLGPWLINRIKAKGHPVVMTLHNYRLICPSATLFHRDRIFLNSISESFPWSAVREKVLDNSLIKTFLTAFCYWSHKKIQTWSKVDRFILFSEFSRDIFQRSTLHLANDKFRIKPNFAQDIQTAFLQKNEQQPFFVYIGRLSVEKGITQLLHAWQNIPFKLKICGTGPLLSQVQDLAKNNPNIEYLGFKNKEELNALLYDAEGLIMPSICYEGMPMTILEAFCLGKPVLCSNIGILNELVIPLFTGLHFDPYSTVSIQSCVTQWASLSSQHKAEIAANCRREYSQKYTAQHNIKQLEAIYQQVITDTT